MTTKGITGSCSRAGSKDTYWGSSSESGGNSASSGHWAAKLGSGFRPYIWKPFLAWAYSPPAAPASSGEWSGTQGLPAPTEGLAPGGPWSLGHGLGTVPMEQPPPTQPGLQFSWNADFRSGGAVELFSPLGIILDCLQV